MPGIIFFAEPNRHLIHRTDSDFPEICRVFHLAYHIADHCWWAFLGCDAFDANLAEYLSKKRKRWMEIEWAISISQPALPQK
jgi:hypothetical protein